MATRGVWENNVLWHSLQMEEFSNEIKQYFLIFYCQLYKKLEQHTWLCTFCWFFWGKRRCQSLLRTLQRVSSICKLNTTTANDLWAKSSINLLRIGASLRYDDKWRLTINIYICNLQERHIIDIKSSRTTDTTDSLQNSQKSSVVINNASRSAYNNSKLELMAWNYEAGSDLKLVIIIEIYGYVRVTVCNHVV